MRVHTTCFAALSLALVVGCNSVRTEEQRSAPAEEARDVAEAAHELSIARGELRVVELERESKLIAARTELQFAEEDLAAARRALEAFKAVERPRAEGESKLDLDRARHRLLDAEAELAELEAMYDADDFAEKTKELVLARGRRSLEAAQRAVALAELEHQHLVSQELPEKERELARALAEAELAAQEARRALERTTLEVDLALAKAKHELAQKEKASAKGPEAKE